MFMKFKLWLEAASPMANPLYHGTAGELFKKFQPNHLSKYDPGDLGVGVYLTDSKGLAENYAQQAAKKTGKQAITLVVWQNFQNTADLDTDEIKILLRDNGYVKELGKTSRGRGLNQQMAQKITQILTQNGFDSARNGSEIVCYDTSRIKITQVTPADDWNKTQQQINGPPPKINIIQKMRGLNWDNSKNFNNA